MTTADEVPKTRILLTHRGRVLGSMLLMATVAAVWTGDPHTRLATALLLGPLVADWIATPRNLGRVRLRVPPRRVPAMAPFREQVRLELPPGFGSLRDLQLREPATQGFRDGWGWLGILEGGPGGDTLALRARSRVRGHQLERVLALSSSFPLGLVRGRAVHRIPAELITEPSRVALPPGLLQRFNPLRPEPEDARKGPGGDFHSLREYQSGEDARSVHPLRSAATGTLVRRVLRGDPPTEWDLVLDLRLSPERVYRKRGPDEVILPRHVWQAFEWQVSACATLLDGIRSEHQRGRLWVLDDERVQELPLDGDENIRRALAHLAIVAPSRWSPIATRLSELGHRPCIWIPAGGATSAAEWEQLGVEPVLVQGHREPGR